MSSLLIVSYFFTLRSLQATSFSTQKRFLHIRRWSRSEYILWFYSLVYFEWTLINLAFNKHLIVYLSVRLSFLQLLQRHPSDGASEWPRHEHTPGWDLTGKCVCLRVCVCCCVCVCPCIHHLPCSVTYPSICLFSPTQTNWTPRLPCTSCISMPASTMME